MKTLLKSIMLAAAMLAFGLQQASADTLLGTTGSGNANSPFSVLVQIDQDTGKLIRTIGSVGYKVNGLAWDRASQILYATTSIKDPHFHGLITIDTTTGVGTPVDRFLDNFGLPGTISPVMAITIDSKGKMVGWYQECLVATCAPDTTDTFVTIDKSTGKATEFNNTGVDAARLGLSFNAIDQLWLIDSPVAGEDGQMVQLIWLIDAATGKPVLNGLLSPPTAAFLGDFSPSKQHYYGINKDPFGVDPTAADLVMVNIKNGKVKTVGPTVRDLHTITFVKRK